MGIILSSFPCRSGLSFWFTPVLSFVLWSKIMSTLVFPMLTWSLTSHRDTQIHPLFHICELQSVLMSSWESLSPMVPNDLNDRTNRSLWGRFQVMVGDWKEKYHKCRAQPIWCSAGYLPRCFCLPCFRVPQMYPMSWKHWFYCTDMSFSWVPSSEISYGRLE